MVILPTLMLLSAHALSCPCSDEGLGAAPWWGGEIESLEVALGVAGEWAREWTPLEPEARVWSDTEGRAVLSCAVQVGERPDQQHHLEALAVDRAFRGAAVQAMPDGEEWLATWVVEGAASLGSGSPVRIRPELRARIATYEHDGRQFTMAILQLAEARSIEVVGLAEMGGDLLAALGHLHLDKNAPEERIAAALGLSQHHAVVNLAGARSLAASSQEGARQVLEVAGQLVCHLGTEYLEGMAQVEALAGDGVGAFARMVALPDVPTRLALLAEWVRASGQTGEPLQVMVAGAPAAFLVTEAPIPGSALLRDAARSLVDSRGHVPLPQTGLSISGRAVPAVTAAPLTTTGLSMGEDWVLVQAAPEQDARLAASLERVELSSSIATGPDAVRAALAEVALRRGLLWYLSSGALDGLASSGKALALAPWVIPTDSGWEVDLLPEAAAIISTAPVRIRFSFQLSAEGMNDDRLGGLRAHLEGLGGSATPGDGPEFVLAVRVREGPLESGVDPGDGFIRERPWRRLSLGVSIGVSSAGELRTVEEVCRTPKIYGASHPRDHTKESIEEGLLKLQGRLAELIQQSLLQPMPVAVTGSDDHLNRLDLLARPFGGGVVDDQTEQLTVRWPRGPIGLRVCAAALAESPTGAWLSSLDIQGP